MSTKRANRLNKPTSRNVRREKIAAKLGIDPAKRWRRAKK